MVFNPLQGAIPRSLQGIEIEGAYVFTRWNNIAGVARAFARVIGTAEAEFANPDVETEVAFELANLADTKSGYWVEVRYPFWIASLSQSFLGRSFANPQFVAVVRWEQVFSMNLLTELAFADGNVTYVSPAWAGLQLISWLGMWVGYGGMVAVALWDMWVTA
jgi:hypothetical protein